MSQPPVRITVTYDGSARLEIETDPPLPEGQWPTLRDGDWAWWSFKNLPEGCLPQIRFANQCGPFNSLRSYQGTSLLGKGNVGPLLSLESGERYEYTAMVLDPAAGILARGTGKIINAATRRDASPQALVSFHPETAEKPAALEVFPQALRLSPGDTASWEVTGIPTGSFATFHFAAQEGSPDPMRGPFEAFYLLPGSGPGTMRASGVGFVATAKEAPERFNYFIRVWSADGTILGGHDPAIDNIGPPIPPPGDDGGH